MRTINAAFIRNGAFNVNTALFWSSDPNKGYIWALRNAREARWETFDRSTIVEAI